MKTTKDKDGTSEPTSKKTSIPKCQICDKKFGTFLKQHQCKRCKRAVCDECSKSKAKIVGYEVEPNKPHRICKICTSESDFQTELRNKGSLRFNSMSEIGVKWAESIGITGEQMFEQLKKSYSGDQFELKTQQNQQDSSGQIQKYQSIGWNYSLAKKRIGFSQLEFFYWVCIKEKEDRINQIMNKLLGRLWLRLGWAETPSGMEVFCLYILSFLPDFLAFEVIARIVEKIMPDYIKQYLQFKEEGDTWNQKRGILMQTYRLDMAQNEIEAKAASAFVFNEGLSILSCMMAENINIQCFHWILNQVFVSGKFEECEKVFLILVKTNIQDIRESKGEDVNLQILRNTQIQPIQKIFNETGFKMVDRAASMRMESKSVLMKEELREEIKTLRNQIEKMKEEEKNSRYEWENSLRVQVHAEIEKSLQIEMESQLGLEKFLQQSQIEEKYKQQLQEMEVQSRQQLKEAFQQRENQLKEKEDRIIAKELEIQQIQENYSLEEIKKNVFFGKLKEKMQQLEAEGEAEKRRVQKEHKGLIDRVREEEVDRVKMKGQEEYLKLLQEMYQASQERERQLITENEKLSFSVEEVKKRIEEVRKREDKIEDTRKEYIDFIFKQNKNREQQLIQQLEQKYNHADLAKLTKSTSAHSNTDKNIFGKYQGQDVTNDAKEKDYLQKSLFDALIEMKTEKQKRIEEEILNEKLKKQISLMEEEILNEREEIEEKARRIEQKEEMMISRVEEKSKIIQEFHLNQQKFAHSSEEYVKNLIVGFDQERKDFIRKLTQIEEKLKEAELIALQERNARKKLEDLTKVKAQNLSDSEQSLDFNVYKLKILELEKQNNDLLEGMRNTKELNRINGELHKIIIEKEKKMQEKCDENREYEEIIIGIKNYSVQEHSKILNQFQKLREKGKEEIAEALEKVASKFEQKIIGLDKELKACLKKLESVVEQWNSTTEINEDLIQLLLANGIKIPQYGKKQNSRLSALSDINEDRMELITENYQRTRTDDSDSNNGCSAPSGCSQF